MKIPQDINVNIEAERYLVVVSGTNSANLFIVDGRVINKISSIGNFGETFYGS